MNIDINLPALIVVVPLFGAMIMVAMGVFYRNIVPYIFQLVSLCSFYFSIKLLFKVFRTGPVRYFFGNWEAPIGIEYYVDHLNILFITVLTFILVVISFYFPKSVIKEINEYKSHIFYAVTMLFMAGLLGITITGDLFNIYVFTEISSITAYALIAMGGEKRSYRASFNYLIYGTIGASFLVLGIGYLYMATGTLNLLDMQQRLVPMYHSKIVVVGAAFIIIGLSMKIALFPLHIWLPGAYTYSPSSISALMSATSTKVMAYVMIRFLYTVFTPKFDVNVIPIQDILMVISMVAIIAGSFMAIGQKDLKMMYAYSSIGQIGYIILGATMLNISGIVGSIYHFASHAVVKGGLFLVSGLIFYLLGTTKIDDVKGLYYKMPYTSFAFLIFALAMIGVPLTSGFISKWYLVLGGIAKDNWFIVIVILLSSLLTAIYFWRVLNLMFFVKPTDHDYKKIKEPIFMVIPIYILVLTTVVLGIFSEDFLMMAKKAAEVIMETAK